MSKYYLFPFIFLFFILAGNNSCSRKSKNTDATKPRKIVSLNKLLVNEMSEFDYAPKIDSQIEKFMQQYELKGVSVAIIKDEKLVYAKGFGYSHAEDSIKMNPGNIFRLASVSKLITAVAIMKLVDEGKLTLESKVFGDQGILKCDKFKPFKDPRVEDITILNLLEHAGGWSQRYGDPMFNPLVIAKLIDEEPPLSINSYFKFALTRKLHFTPGMGNSYSNLGYLFLGEVIKEVSGMSYENFIRKKILQPIGITDMHIAENLLKDKRKNEVCYYSSPQDSLIFSYKGDSLKVTKTYGGNDIKLLGGAGAWLASAPELALLMVHIDGFEGVDDILKPESISLMTGGYKHFLGWKQKYYDGWLRTGTFSGTSTVIYRGDNGIQWVFLSNTSSWKGPIFSKYIFRLMKRVTDAVPVWHDNNLFEKQQFFLSNHSPIDASITNMQ